MEIAKQKIRDREEGWSSGDDSDGGSPIPPEDASLQGDAKPDYSRLETTSHQARPNAPYFARRMARKPNDG
jgi:hypothetical protein